MSIEDKISELTAAIGELASGVKELVHLTRGGAAPGEVAKPTATKDSSKKDSPKKDAKPADPAGSQSTAQESAAPESKQDTSGSKGSSGQIDFAKEIGPRFIALIREKGEAAGREVIKTFAKDKENPPLRLTEAVKPEQYAEVLALIEKLIAKE